MGPTISHSLFLSFSCPTRSLCLSLIYILLGHSPNTFHKSHRLLALSLSPSNSLSTSHAIMGSRLLPYSAKHGTNPLSLQLLMLLVAHALPLALAQRSPEPPGSVDPYSNMKFSPSLAIIIVVLISALFFMGFFSIYIRHCSDSSNSVIRPAGAGGNRSRRGAARGLDREVIDTFPTFVYSEVKTLKVGKGALECAVCLNEFEDDETLRLIPKCDHVFHPECIDAWLELHTTCPVCRSNLASEPGETTPQPSELGSSEVDLEAQNDAAVAAETPQETQPQPQGSQPPEPQGISVNFTNQTLNRNRTRGSRSGRPRKFPRSHSTGHSLVQPGEDTERFTLRLPVDVRKQIMNRELNRSHSLVVLPREASSRRGYRTGGGGEGSSRGRNTRWLDRSFKSDRWVFSMAPPFFQRASSLKTTKVAADDAQSSSVQPAGSSGESSRPPV